MATATLNPSRALGPAPQSHESYILAVRDIIINAHPNVATRDRMAHIKVVYGTGSGMGARGVTYYGTWRNSKPAPVDTVEVCAFGEESPVQLVGTTIHELAHVVAGYAAGHGSEWKATCADLGLLNAEAGGQSYAWESFDTRVRESLQAIPMPTDGSPSSPILGGHGGPLVPMPGMRPRSGPRPCPLGIGTRGGKSRGIGSGSRLRLYHCRCPKPVKVRVASDTFDATCNLCRGAFTRAPRA